jgi:hypothetical protein
LFDKKGRALRKERTGYIELDNSNKNSNLMGYKVALVDTSKCEKQALAVSEFGYKLTSVNCDEKNINLFVHTTFKFGTQSCLLFQNKLVCLVVFEMGDDNQREFTREAVNIVRNEMTQALE